MKNARAANAFAALILIGCRHVKQLGLANENLRIPEDTISMPKLFCRVKDFISKWKIS